MYDRTCIGCGNQFSTAVFRQRRCRKGCSVVVQRKEREALRFVGVDGEGVDRPDGRHEYVMLSVGQNTLYDEGRMLGSLRIFEFLYENFTNDPSACYVGFFLGYDFIQWERNLPEDRAWYLLSADGIKKRTSSRRGSSPYPDAVVWGGWEFDILAGRRWKLRPHHHRRSRYYRECRNRTCDYVYDRDAEGQLITDGEPRWMPIGEELFSPENSTVSGTDYDGIGWNEYWHRFAVHNVSSPISAPVEDDKWMYICDTGPFWQTSFLNVINPKGWDNPICSEEEYATVVKGKADRGMVADYTDTSYAEEMARYNILENDILARVTGRLDAGFRNPDIPIRISNRDWYGPGRAAQLWMDSLSDLVADPDAVEHNKTMRRNPDMGLERKNEYTLRNIDVYADMPEWAQLAAQRTYYGGWFEQMVHGHIGTVYEYDINSAYPYVISQLPCLHTTGPHTGRWTQGTGSPSGLSVRSKTIVRANIRGSNPYIGAMPYRSPQGNISRPNNLEGWYWLHELEASKRAGLVDQYDVLEWVSLDPCDCPPPFNPESIGIARMYDLRLQVGKNSPQGKGFKLVYNSAYGKTAQSIGNPKYSNPLYASLITAGCRIQIIDSIATHPVGPAAVTMVATDGVYFTSPHPGLELSPSVLGMWDETVKHGLTQLMPGVYWDDKTRKAVRDGGTVALKSRGVNARDLARRIENLDEEFHRLTDSTRNGVPSEWPNLEFRVGFLLDSAKASLARGKWDQAGRVQHDTTRKISSDPRTKRIPTPYLDGGLVRTRPYTEYPVPSLDYHKTFGYREWNAAQELFDDMISPDGGDGMMWFRDLLNET